MKRAESRLLTRQDSCDSTRPTAAAAIVSKPQSHCRVFVSLTGLGWTRLYWCVRTLRPCNRRVHGTHYFFLLCFLLYSRIQAWHQNNLVRFLVRPRDISSSVSRGGLSTRTLTFSDTGGDFFGVQRPWRKDIQTLLSLPRLRMCLTTPIVFIVPTAVTLPLCSLNIIH